MNRQPQNFKYKPDYAVPPGETLLEILEHKGMTQLQLAERTGKVPKTINEIVQGKNPITPETALQFERVLGVPASFWNNLEKNYRQVLARLAEEKSLEFETQRLNQLPVKQLIKAKCVECCDNAVEQLKEVLSFYGVASPVELDTVVAKSVAYRQSAVYMTDPWIGAAWLRLGEIEAQNAQPPAFNFDKFKENLSKIRALTQKPLGTEVVKEWKNLCFEAGVVLVFVPEIAGLRVNGAAYWLKGRPVIQLSLRHKRADILWFSFFHEAGHILKHGKEIFIDYDNADDAKEKEADAFAANFLIPRKDLQELTRETISKELVLAFAGRLGIDPGIVVGRLQHDGLLRPNCLNDLKSKVVWA